MSGNHNWGARLQEVINRGAEWVARQQEANGEFRDCGKELRAYYKVPLMLAGAGRLLEATRCLKFIQHALRNDEGELCSGEGDVKSTFERFGRNFANYMDGWVAISAWLLGEYAFADEICLRLLEFQSKTHGAVATGPRKWVGARRYDVLTNASAGRAFLITGRRQAARALADFLLAAIDEPHQRDSAAGLDMSFDDEWRQVEAPDPAERPYYRFLVGERGERVFCPAFACAFLCDASQVFRDTRYLQAAHSYFSFITVTPEFQENSLSNGKSGWAAGMLALATGDRECARTAVQIVGNVLARQSDEGEFASRRGGQMPLARRLETSAEQTAWCVQYLRMFALGLWDD